MPCAGRLALAAGPAAALPLPPSSVQGKQHWSALEWGGKSKVRGSWELSVKSWRRAECLQRIAWLPRCGRRCLHAMLGGACPARPLLSRCCATSLSPHCSCSTTMWHRASAGLDTGVSGAGSWAHLPLHSLLGRGHGQPQATPSASSIACTLLWVLHCSGASLPAFPCSQGTAAV